MNSGDAPTPALSVRGLVKRYPGASRPAVDGLSFDVPRGHLVSLLGPNGAGKTTTIEICQGFLRPDSGQVQVMGLDPHASRANLAAVKVRVGAMPQGGGAYNGARTGELLRLVAAYYEHPLDPEWLLAILGLTQHEKTPHRLLSGGQKQRLSLACALVGRPELVFLDEPTAGLDTQSRHLVWDLVRALRADGASIVLTTHLLDEAERLSDRIVIVDKGQAVAQGTPAELTASSSEHTIRISLMDGTRPLDLSALHAVVPPQVGVHALGNGSIRLNGAATPELLAAVTAEAARQGVLLSAISVDHFTLEDVFLQLTGKDLRP